MKRLESRTFWAHNGGLSAPLHTFRAKACRFGSQQQQNEACGVDVDALGLQSSALYSFKFMIMHDTCESPHVFWRARSKQEARAEARGRAFRLTQIRF